MQTETWKTIPGFDSSYEVSDMGNLRRNMGDGFFSRLGQAWGKKLKAYRSTSLVLLNGQRVTRPIHTLVCLAFLGPRPSPKHETNHINGIKTDNRLVNLEWVTKHENTMHAVRTGLTKQHLNRRYTPAQELQILDYNFTAKQLAKKFGSTVHSIVGVRHRHRVKLAKR